MSKLVDQYLDEMQMQEFIGVGAAIALGGFEVATLLMSAYKMYKNYFTAAAKRCADLSPKEKSLCMLKAKTLARNAEIQNLKVSLAKCDKSNNAEKCKMRIGSKIKAIAGDIEQLNSRYADVRRQPEGLPDHDH